MTPKVTRGEASVDSVAAARPTMDADPAAGASAPGGAFAPGHDRVRWSAVWAGTLLTLITNLVLQLLFYALGWLDLGSGSSMTANVVSGVLGLVAFLVGAVMVGASGVWARLTDGWVNGVTSWALTVMLLLIFGLAGAGALLGSFASVVGGFGTLRGGPAVAVPRTTAGLVVLGLVLSLIVSALGGTLGAKITHGSRSVR
jgi:hypothetical protein